MDRAEGQHWLRLLAERGDEAARPRRDSRLHVEVVQPAYDETGDGHPTLYFKADLDLLVEALDEAGEDGPLRWREKVTNEVLDALPVPLRRGVIVELTQRAQAAVDA